MATPAARDASRPEPPGARSRRLPRRWSGSTSHSGARLPLDAAGSLLETRHRNPAAVIAGPRESCRSALPLPRSRAIVSTVATAGRRSGGTMHLDRRLLGWGLFFIIVGAIPLATRAGYLDPELVGRWPSLWPLLLIGFGLGLVLRRTAIDWLGGAVTAVVFGVMGGGLLSSAFAGAPISTGCGGERAGTA